MEQDATKTPGNGDWTAKEGLDSAAASLEDVDRRLRPHIDAHPFVAVALAAAAGFLLARLVSRS